MSTLKNIDSQVAEAIKLETERQNHRLELIASENFVSEAVLEALGSVMTNKYAEGYPGKRYYGGCSFVDVVEDLAIERVKKLFGVDHANVQPHSGTQANMAVYFSLLKPGDSYLGMSLSHGGHLSMGSPVNFSGNLYRVIPYGVRREDHVIDYDEVRRLAKDHRPKLIVAGACAYPRIIDYTIFREIADEIGSYFMVDIAHIAGLVIAGLHPSPVPLADFITSTTHKTLRGPRGGMALCRKKFAHLLDNTVFPGMQGGPLMHVIAAKAVAFKEALRPEFKEYQQQVVKNAKAIADQLLSDGFQLVSGGTDTHLVLLDLTDIGLSGKVAEETLDKAGITVNKNTIPFDTKSPFITSGIRLGTPALTTRGMKEPEMKVIGGFIAKVLRNVNDEKLLEDISAKIEELCRQFPLYSARLG